MYRKEVLNEISGAGGAHEERVLGAIASISDTLPSEYHERVMLAVSMLDPTGVLSYPDVAKSYRNFEKEPTFANAGWFLLAAAAAIPIAGKLVDPAKAVKLAKAAEVVKDGAKILDTVKDGAKLAAKINKEADEAIKSLNAYIRTNQGLGMFRGESLQTLLKMTKTGKAVGYSGKAYRGARASNVMHLVDQLTIPGIKNRGMVDWSALQHGKVTLANFQNQADHFFKTHIQKAFDKPGEWVEIPLPTKGVTMHAERRANSFTKNWKQAESFADQSGGRAAADKFEVIFQTSGDNFVDVVETMKKNKIKMDNDLIDEEEVLAVGNTIVEKIFVRRLQ